MPCSVDCLNALDGHGALAFELLAIAILLLLLAVFQTRAVVALQHTVLATKVSLAEAAVAHDALGGVLAVLCVAADLLWCATADGKRHV